MGVLLLLIELLTDVVVVVDITVVFEELFGSEGVVELTVELVIVDIVVVELTEFVISLVSVAIVELSVPCEFIN